MAAFPSTFPPSPKRPLTKPLGPLTVDVNELPTVLDATTRSGADALAPPARADVLAPPGAGDWDAVLPAALLNASKGGGGAAVGAATILLTRRRELARLTSSLASSRVAHRELAASLVTEETAFRGKRSALDAAMERGRTQLRDAEAKLGRGLARLASETASAGAVDAELAGVRAEAASAGGDVALAKAELARLLRYGEYLAAFAASGESEAFEHEREVPARYAQLAATNADLRGQVDDGAARVEALRAVVATARARAADASLVAAARAEAVSRAVAASARGGRPP